MFSPSKPGREAGNHQACFDRVLLVAGRGGCERIADRLVAEGYDVDVAESLGVARVRLSSGVDVVVLVAGEEWALGLLRELRAGRVAGADRGVPVLAVGLGSVERLVLCHAAGADLVLESCGGRDVCLALRALAARRGGPLRVGGVLISREERAAYAGGVLLPLTRIEFDLLVVLAEGANRLVRLEALAERVWGGCVASSTVGARVCGLRRKLSAADAGVELQTRYGVGYHLVETGPGPAENQQEGNRKATAFR